MFIRPSRFNFIKRSNIFTPGSRSLKTSSHTFQKINRDNTPGETVRDSNETPKKIAASVETVLDRGKEKLFEVVSIYEEAIGLKEIKEAQDNVLKAEKNFVNAQKLRRDLNAELQGNQARLRKLRDEMDRLNRTDSQFLKLFTEEHEILKREKLLVDDYKLREDEERDLFFYLSASLRDSQEKERARVEKMKYLQLGLSIACTSLGIISAFLLSYFRNSSISEILKYEKEQFANTSELMNQIIERQNEVHVALNQSTTAQNALHDILKGSIAQSILRDMMKPPPQQAPPPPPLVETYRPSGQEILIQERHVDEPAPKASSVKIQDSGEMESETKPLMVSDLLASPRNILATATAVLGFIYFYTK